MVVLQQKDRVRAESIEPSTIRVDAVAVAILGGRRRHELDRARPQLVAGLDLARRFQLLIGVGFTDLAERGRIADVVLRTTAGVGVVRLRVVDRVALGVDKALLAEVCD